jgi:uncharacterized protein
MITREAELEFEEIIKSKTNRNVVILEGARQVGKTSLLHQVLKSFHEVVTINFEVESIINERIKRTQSFDEFLEVLKNEKNFSKDSTSVVFIDEAQENHRVGAYIRQMKEECPATRWILTGSSMTRLFQDDQRVPVGRISRYKLNPFSFVDFLTALRKEALKEALLMFPETLKVSSYGHDELLNYSDRYLEVGGLPEVVMTFSEGGDYRRATQQILLAQEDDFVRKTRLEKRHIFQTALRGIANSIGFPSHYSHISEKTYEAKELVSELERWHLVNTVEQKSLTATTAFHPKRYLYDLGVCQLLRSHPFPTISLITTLDKALRTPLGGLFENMVLFSLQGSTIGNLEISSWKKNSKEALEVDFIWKKGKKTIPIECKASMKINDSLTSLKSYLRLSGMKEGILVSAAPFKVLEDKEFRIINLPVYLARSEIIDDLVT